MKILPVKLTGNVEDVLATISDRWQTSTMIASQITWAPEAIAREKLNRESRDAHNQAGSSITSSFAARVLYILAKTGRCERRPVFSRARGSMAKYEYRLTPEKKERGWMKRAVLKAVEAAEDPYSIEGIPPGTVAAYLWQLRKAEAGR
jgi:hypothetical protein